MTHTIMNEQDNERKVYYLKELKRFGMTDEELRWMYENLTLSMISNIHSYPNRRIRFEYWFNVIKDINVSSDVLTVIYISNVDCSPVEVSEHHAYKPGPYSKALNTLHDSGDMTSRNLLRFLDLVRLTYNHTHKCSRIRNGKYINKYNNWQVIKWLDYINFDSYSNIVDSLTDNKVSIDTIINDVDFMAEYSSYFELSESDTKTVNKFLNTFNEIIEEYEVRDAKEREKAKNKAKESERRVIEYINSGTRLSPKKYWNRMFGESYKSDIDSVKEYFPDTYEKYILYIRGLATNKFTTRIHTLINMYNKLSEKFDNLYNITLFDYLSNGGTPDISGTLDFILSQYGYINSPEIRKLIGPLKKLSRYTRSYVNQKDEIKNLHIIKDHELTTEEKQKIFDYMHTNNYPQWTVLFNQIARAYIEGTIEL